jgi:hypothetical protein
MNASHTVRELLAEIERLKREKPQFWQRDARATLRALQSKTYEDDFRETTPNGDRRGYESVGRKCRSTKIQPPI